MDDEARMAAIQRAIQKLKQAENPDEPKEEDQ